MRKLAVVLFTFVVIAITSCALFEPYEVSSKLNTQPKPSWPICYESSWDQVTHGGTPTFRVTLYENGTVSMEMNNSGYVEKIDGYYYGSPQQNGQISIRFKGTEFDDTFRYGTIEGKYLFINFHLDVGDANMTIAFKRKEN